MMNRNSLMKKTKAELVAMLLASEEEAEDRSKNYRALVQEKDLLEKRIATLTEPQDFPYERREVSIQEMVAEETPAFRKQVFECFAGDTAFPASIENKIRAIRLVREVKNCLLVSAKDYIEHLIGRYGLSRPSLDHPSYIPGKFRTPNDMKVAWEL